MRLSGLSGFLTLSGLLVSIILMTYRSKLGSYGEDLAVEYLLKGGYVIVSRNFRKPWGEIDIIAKDKKGTLVFFEIKTVRNQSAITDLEITPEEEMTKPKIKKLTRTCSLYAGENQELILEKYGWQIDVLAITIYEHNIDIKHYPNIIG